MSFLFRERGLLLAFLACLCLTVASASADTVTLTPQEQNIADHIVNDPNQHRPFLHLDPILTKVARQRAADMAARGYFDHVDPQGIGPNYKVQQAGYQLPAGWTNPISLNYIESIAAGRSTADATWSDWMSSQPHREHLLGLDPGYAEETSFGVGFVSAPNSQYLYYWVVITCPPALNLPSVTITSPAAKAQVTTDQVTLTGTTSGNVAVQSVVFWVGNGTPQTALGTTSWAGTLTGLVPGPNTIQAESLGSGGSVLAQTALVVNYMVYLPLTVGVTGNGSVTSSFLGTTQQAEGFSYTITAKPAPGSLFAGWSGTVSSSQPALKFTMVEGQTETATFILNPFPALSGTYLGLLQGGGPGDVKLTISKTGTYTANIKVDGHTYSAKGRIGIDGSSTMTIARHGLAPIQVSFHLDLTGTSGVTGSLNDGTTTMTFGSTQNYRPAAGRFASTGRYTVSISVNSTAPDPNAPQGNGIAVLTINRAGHATITGSMADGKSFMGAAQATGDSASNLVFYIPMYAGLGGVFGKVTIEDTAGADLDGSFRWIKPQRLADSIAPTGFDTSVPVAGSHYVAPAAHTPVLPVSVQQVDNSQLIFGDGDLAQQIVQPATLNSANQISIVQPALPGLKVIIHSGTGLFSGSFIHPMTGRKTPLHGVIFQKQNAGYGYFLGENAGGYSNLLPVP